MQIRISLFALGQRETGKPRKRRQKGNPPRSAKANAQNGQLEKKGGMPG